MATKRKKHLRLGGYETLKLIGDLKGNADAEAVANIRGINKKEAYNMLKRLQEMDLALGIPRPEGFKRPRIYYHLTLNGHATLDQFLRAPRRTVMADEDEDDTDHESTPWPRKNPDEVVAQALRTQPVSVFDMARMMAN